MTQICDRCSGFGWINWEDANYLPCPKCRGENKMDATITSDWNYLVLRSDLGLSFDRRSTAITRAKSSTNLDGKKYLVLKVIGYAEQQPTRAVWVDLEEGKC